MGVRRLWLNSKELDVEVEGRVRRDHPSCATAAVPQLRRHRDLTALPDLRNHRANKRQSTGYKLREKELGKREQKKAMESPDSVQQ